MKNKQLAAILTGTLFAATTQLAVAAKGPNYTYAEIGYVNTDDDLVEGDGFDVNISFGATDLIFLKFGYQRDSLDVGPSGSQVGIDADEFLIGGGAHFKVMDKLDLYGTLSYVDIEYSGGIPVQGDDGYELAAGVRSMVTKKLELHAEAAYRDIDNLENNDDDERIYSVGAVYKFYKKFSAYARISGDNRYDSSSDAVDTIGLGIRLSL
jgi:hypothetical protein